MQQDYSPRHVESDAQAYWSEHQVFRAVEDPARDKFYCLSMFPYPSGRLHMGHVRNYTIGDVVSRYQRMCGKNVLQPIGFDAFGLPAENAAIKNGVPPAAWTYSNIDYMCGQLRQLGFAYDWERKFATCEPDYYRWQQWFFVQLFRKGLIYRKNSIVNWDPVDQTVLANEQVIDGRGWRSGAVVEQREIPQWFLKITAYADELLDELKNLEHWPEAVKTMQANWIGRSEGLEIDFRLGQASATGADHLTVFTTRPDTLYGVTYLAVAAQHPLALEAAQRDPKVAAFVEESKLGDVTEATLETMEKRGVPLGIDVIHPLTGARVPVWAANFVLMGYGSGAVMAVPGHDQRDWEFARAYGLPIQVVIGAEPGKPSDISEAAHEDKGWLINSAEFDGLEFKPAFDAIAARLEVLGQGRKRINYRLRDWGVSRQRYWGCPIPIIYCESCDAVPVPEDQLPVRLPEDLVPDGRGNPLLRLPEFVNVPCPQCGKPARRETDTCDTFVDSSWYFARFASATQKDAMLDGRAAYWLPVDQYIGGIEHAILHLLYARFFQKLMRDVGVSNVGEPFKRLLTQGMVLAEAYYRTTDSGGREWIAPKDVEVERDAKGAALGAVLKSTREPVTAAGLGTMSKSKNNGVDPQEIIDSHGADAVRLFMMFTAPPEQTLEWSDAGIDGAARFLRRVWKLVYEHTQQGAVQPLDVVALSADQKELRRKLHDSLARIGNDFERRFNFNTAIAACMELVNAVSRFDDTSPNGCAVMQEVLDALVRVLSPIVPHITHQLWFALGHARPVIDAAWPQAEASARVADTVLLVVQINGKRRSEITVPSDAGKDQIVEAALADENAQKFLAGQPLKKTVVVPGKLVNFVV
ncbi:leucine--tRNA ligase [Nevskia soli]|uniref:leucine--tRNA ligase n=1 Tax=Nevskia soli TaxID=418856 RepID=UPI0004A729E4|nr:leucine--tRNA ligase [Nevskia soli]